MALRNEQLRTEIRRLSRVIAQIEAKPEAEWRLWAATLRDLVAERRMLARIIAARCALSQRKVVELGRWRDPAAFEAGTPPGGARPRDRVRRTASRERVEFTQS
jgi:hypothetical protein